MALMTKTKARKPFAEGKIVLSYGSNALNENGLTIAVPSERDLSLALSYYELRITDAELDRIVAFRDKCRHPKLED